MLAAGSWAGSSEVKVSTIQSVSQAHKALPALLGPEHPASLLFRLCPSLEIEGAP